MQVLLVVGNPLEKSRCFYFFASSRVFWKSFCISDFWSWPPGKHRFYNLCSGTVRREFHPSAEWDVPYNIWFVSRAFWGQCDSLSATAVSEPWLIDLAPGKATLAPELSTLWLNHKCSILLLSRKIDFAFSSISVGGWFVCSGSVCVAFFVVVCLFLMVWHYTRKK